LVFGLFECWRIKSVHDFIEIRLRAMLQPVQAEVEMLKHFAGKKLAALSFVIVKGVRAHPRIGMKNQINSD
jgi:hypothetical protein